VVQPQEEIPVNENLSVEAGNDEERIRATLNGGLDRLMRVSADLVFAQPVRVGDRVVIPAATVEFSGGFGFGGDVASNGDRPADLVATASAAEAGPSGVRVKPVIDFTRVGLTVLAAALTVWRAARK